jgi:hypothetical protein
MSRTRQPGFFFGPRIYAAIDRNLASAARSQGDSIAAQGYSTSSANLYRQAGDNASANRQRQYAQQDASDTSSHTVTVRSRSRCCW